MPGSFRSGCKASAINAARGSHLKRWPCLESKGIDTIKLGTLSQILSNRSVNDVNTVATFMTDALLDQRSDDGPWVFLVPEQLQAALVSLDEEAQDTVAEKWAATEEFSIAGWLLADVEDYLQDLVAHARKSRQAEKSLLPWLSL
jgi:serine protease inhibitor